MYIIIKYRYDLPYFDLVAIVRSFEQDEQMKLVDIYMDPILPASYYIYICMLSWTKFDLYPSALPTLSKLLVCRNARDHVRANLLCGNRKIHIQCTLIWRPMGQFSKPFKWAMAHQTGLKRLIQ